MRFNRLIVQVFTVISVVLASVASATVSCPTGVFVATGSNTGFDGWSWTATSDQGDITNMAANYCGLALGWTLSGTDPEYTTGPTADCTGTGDGPNCTYTLRLLDPNTFSFCIRFTDIDGDFDCTYNSADVPVELQSFTVE